MSPISARGDSRISCHGVCSLFGVVGTETQHSVELDGLSDTRHFKVDRLRGEDSAWVPGPDRGICEAGNVRVGGVKSVIAAKEPMV